MFVEGARRGGASIGQHVIVPSSLTGAPLDYFVPYPLPEVAAQCRTSSSALPGATEDFSSILPLIPLLATGRSDSFDINLLKLHAQVACGLRSPRSTSELIDFGNEINGSPAGLRQQIVYSGGPTPSSAGVIYPPASELPGLVESMAEFLGSDLSGWSADELAVLVCEYAVRVHPFNASHYTQVRASRLPPNKGEVSR
jgi:hypothetical protein